MASQSHPFPLSFTQPTPQPSPMSPPMDSNGNAAYSYIKGDRDNDEGVYEDDDKDKDNKFGGEKWNEDANTNTLKVGGIDLSGSNPFKDAIIRNSGSASGVGVGAEFGTGIGSGATSSTTKTTGYHRSNGNDEGSSFPPFNPFGDSNAISSPTTPIREPKPKPGPETLNIPSFNPTNNLSNPSFSISSPDSSIPPNNTSAPNTPTPLFPRSQPQSQSHRPNLSLQTTKLGTPSTTTSHDHSLSFAASPISPNGTKGSGVGVGNSGGKSTHSRTQSALATPKRLVSSFNFPITKQSNTSLSNLDLSPATTNSSLHHQSSSGSHHHHHLPHLHLPHSHQQSSSNSYSSSTIPGPTNTTDRARYETRKLLSHLLDRLSHTLAKLQKSHTVSSLAKERKLTKNGILPPGIGNRNGNGRSNGGGGGFGNNNNNNNTLVGGWGGGNGDGGGGGEDEGGNGRDGGMNGLGWVLEMLPPTGMIMPSISAANTGAGGGGGGGGKLGSKVTSSLKRENRKVDPTGGGGNESVITGEGSGDEEKEKEKDKESRKDGKKRTSFTVTKIPRSEMEELTSPGGGRKIRGRRKRRDSNVNPSDESSSTTSDDDDDDNDEDDNENNNGFKVHHARPTRLGPTIGGGGGSLGRAGGAGGSGTAGRIARASSKRELASAEEALEETVGFVAQLRDVLLLSGKAGWDLFDEEVEQLVDGADEGGRRNEGGYGDEPLSPLPSPPPSPSTPSARNRFFNVPSLSTPGGHSVPFPSRSTQGRVLLSSLLAIFSRLVLLSSIPLASPKPSRPPLALQWLTLDTATALLSTLKPNDDSGMTGRRLREMERLGIAMLGGFESWGEGMKGKLATFFESMLKEGLDMWNNLRIKQEEMALKRSGSKPGGLRYDAGFDVEGDDDFLAWDRRRHDPSTPVQVPQVKIDEPAETLAEGVGDHDGSKRKPVSIRVGLQGRSSTYAGMLPSSTYRLTSLIAPVLNACLGNIDVALFSTMSERKPSNQNARNKEQQTFGPRLDTAYRLRRMIETMMLSKADLYLDILEVVAYGDHVARKSSLIVLSTFYPSAVGHLSVTGPFPRMIGTTSVEEPKARSGQGPPGTRPRFSNAPAGSRHTRGLSLASQSNEDPHCFIPWRFPGRDISSRDVSRRTSFQPGGGGLGSSSSSRETSLPFLTAAGLPGAPSFSDLTSAPPCIECSEPVTGFALLCTSGHHDPMHLGCLNTSDGSFIAHYETSAGMNKIAAPRFSYVYKRVPASRTRLFGALPSSISQIDGENSAELRPVITSGSHLFRLVNLFTIVICFICKKPLWGVTAQGYKCDVCCQFAHGPCLSSRDYPSNCRPIIDSRPVQDITIDWEELRLDFVEQYRDLMKPEPELEHCTHEEVLIYYTFLWLQAKLLHNGIASGCVVVEQAGPLRIAAASEHIDPFELQYFVRLYEAYLSQSRLSMSDALLDYCDTEGIGSDQQVSLLFSLPFLTWLVALARAPEEREAGGITQKNPLLAAAGYLPAAQSQDAQSASFLDIMRASLFRDALRQSLDLEDREAPADMLTKHLLTCGLVEQLEGRPAAPLRIAIPPSTQLIFPLPNLIDPSPSVESLVLAIESCLLDHDLSIQESGLLLLLRRASPSGFSSLYALERLCRGILQWVLDDAALFEFTRAQVAAQARGARSNAESTVVGGDYVAVRGILIKTLATPWMRLLHEDDPDRYSELLFSLTASISAPGDTEGTIGAISASQANDASKMQDEKVAFADRLLRNLTKLHQAEITFSSFEVLISRWLDEVVTAWQTFSRDDVPLSFKSLLRLFDPLSRDPALSRSGYSTADPQIDDSKIPGAPIIDAWALLTKTVEDGAEGLSRGTRWLRVVAQSGVEVPIDILSQLLHLCKTTNAAFDVFSNFAEALYACSWTRLVDRADLAEIITQLYLSQSSYVFKTLNDEVDVDAAVLFIRRSLAAFLLSGGVNVTTLRGVDLVTEWEARVYGSSRKRRTAFTDHRATPCPPEFLDALTKLVQTDFYSVRSVVGKFLFALIVHPNSLNLFSQNSELLKINAQVLSTCVFKFFDPNQTDLTGIRIPLLLALLASDQDTYGRLLGQSSNSGYWEHRFSALDSLFLMITELHVPTGSELEEGYSSTQLQFFIPVIKQFFNAVWDDEEAVRQKAEVLIKSLQQPHFDTIAYCLQSRFGTADLQERQSILNLLIQLRAIKPAWQVLSWPIIIDGLFAQELAVQMARGNNVSTDDAESTWLLLLILALSLIADGQTIDQISTLVKLKYHLVRFLGFANLALRPSMETNTFEVVFSAQVEIPDATASVACLALLKRVLDVPTLINSLQYTAGQTIKLSEESPKELIGTTMVDVVPSLINSDLDTTSLSYSQVRNILECLSITVYKHDLDGNSHRRKEFSGQVIRAVKRITDLLLEKTTSYDNKLLILATCLSLLKRFPDKTVSILGHQILVVVRMMSNFPATDALHIHGRAFLFAAFSKYAGRGIFVLLFRNLKLEAFSSEEESGGRGGGEIAEGFYSVVGGMNRDLMMKNQDDDGGGAEILGDLIVQDVMRGALKESRSGMRSNLLHLYHYLEMAYSDNMTISTINAIAEFLGRLERHIIDWNPEDIHGSALLKMCALLIQANPDHCQGILLQTETLLHVVLPRFVVTQKALSRLAQATSVVHKLHPQLVFVDASAIYLGALLEGLSRRMRMPSQTLTALLQTFIDESGAIQDSIPLSRTALRSRSRTRAGSINKFSNAIGDDPLRLAQDCIEYIRGAATTSSSTTTMGLDRFSRTEFSTIVTASKLSVLCLHLDSGVWNSVLNQEVSNGLRIANFITLGALELGSPYHARTLLRYTASVADINCMTLQQCLAMRMSNSMASDVMSELLAQSFANLRLWMLLIRLGFEEKPLVDKGEMEMARLEGIYGDAVWWVCEALLERGSLDAHFTGIDSIIWTSFAEVIISLHHLGSSLVLDSTSKWASMFSQFALKPSVTTPGTPGTPGSTGPLSPGITGMRQDPVTLKGQKVLASFSDPPPRREFESLREDVATDLFAAVKWRQQAGRM